MDRAFARVSILFTCLYGLVFLWLRERTGSLIFPLLAHNLVNVVLTTPWPFLNICGWAVVPGWSDTTRLAPASRAFRSTASISAASA